MKAMYQEFGLTGNTYSVEDVARTSSSVAGADLSWFFDAYVEGVAELPLQEYLDHAGLQATIVFGEPEVDRDYVIHELLQIQSLRRTEDGFTIRRSQEAGFRDDDKLVAVDDTPVRRFDDLVEGLKNSEPGDSVALTVERNGEKLLINFVLGGHKGELATQRSVEVTITEKSEISAEEQAILNGILGN
jgi:predicted metalloprotease with PDZ domain